MRGLKTAIVVMGVLIVVCTVVLVTTLVRRASAPPAPIGGMLSIPAGAAIEGQALDGRRLLLRLRLADGTQRLLIADLETARELGHIQIVPGAPTPGLGSGTGTPAAGGR